MVSRPHGSVQAGGDDLPPLSSTLALLDERRESRIASERRGSAFELSSTFVGDEGRRSRMGSSYGVREDEAHPRLQTDSSELRTSPGNNASPFMFQPPPLPRESSASSWRLSVDRNGAGSGADWRRPSSSTAPDAHVISRRLGSSSGATLGFGLREDGGGSRPVSSSGRAAGASQLQLPPLRTTHGPSRPGSSAVASTLQSEVARPSSQRSGSWSRPLTSGDAPAPRFGSNGFARMSSSGKAPRATARTSWAIDVGRWSMICVDQRAKNSCDGRRRQLAQARPALHRGITSATAPTARSLDATTSEAKLAHR